jgi:hypothetical protein
VGGPAAAGGVPFDEAGRGSRYLVFDRDTIFSAVVDAVA